VREATGLLARCRAQGIELSAGPGGALAWEADSALPADVAEGLARHKADVLALLAAENRPRQGPSPLCPTVPTVPEGPPVRWQQAEADALLAQVQARRRQCFGERGWPEDRAARVRLAERAGAIDAAWFARDLPGLRRAASDYLALLSSPGKGAEESTTPPGAAGAD
jgi:hypothetical protein